MKKSGTREIAGKVSVASYIDIEYSVPMSVLLEEALKLPVAERRKLAEDLWESIDGSPEAFDLTPEQAAELQRRIEYHEKYPEEGIPWETVRDEALARK